jgi:ferric-dicitrate binding protein FerR (iron transport regulator)
MESLGRLLQKEKGSRGVLRRIRPVLKYAAALIIFCGCYFVYQWVDFSKNTPMSAHQEQRERVHMQLLPDGSEITLFGNSTFETLSYDEHSRSILLIGRADFSVVPSKVPFFVHTESGYFTKVLGTKFEVQDVAGKYRVAVERGRVSVGKGEDIVGILSKGDSLIAVGADLQLFVSSNSPLVFDGMKLADVLHTINRAYDTQVELADNLDGSEKCTASFERYLSVTEVVDVLCEMYGYTYTIEGRRIIIK